VSTILVVDDIMVVEFCCFVLAGMDGTNILSASEEFEALELARSYRGKIDVLLADIHLTSGALCGLQLAERLARARPGVDILLMSESSSDEVLLRPGWHFITKPFPPGSLVQKVQLALGRPRRKANML
jgi:CheY-like chemotaxis protein